MTWYHKAFPSIPIPDWVRREFTNIPSLDDWTDPGAHPRFRRQGHDVVTTKPLNPYIWVFVHDDKGPIEIGVYIDYADCPDDGFQGIITAIETGDEQVALGAYIMAGLLAFQFGCDPPPVMRQAGKGLYSQQGVAAPGIPPRPAQGQKTIWRMEPGEWPDWMPGTDPGAGAHAAAYDPADIETINRHRSRIGGDPIDVSAGWTTQEIADMAENIRSRGTTHNPEPCPDVPDSLVREYRRAVQEENLDLDRDGTWDHAFDFVTSHDDAPMDESELDTECAREWAYQIMEKLKRPYRPNPGLKRKLMR